MRIKIKKHTNKYHNRKIKSDDGVFDSLLEWRRFNALQILKKLGKIKELKRQVRIPLSELKNCKCHYIADFVYLEDDVLIVEDCKGIETKEFIVKMKWLLNKYDNFIFRITKEKAEKHYSDCCGSIDLKQIIYS